MIKTQDKKQGDAGMPRHCKLCKNMNVKKGSKSGDKQCKIGVSYVHEPIDINHVSVLKLMIWMNGWLKELIKQCWKIIKQIMYKKEVSKWDKVTG